MQQNECGRGWNRLAGGILPLLSPFSSPAYVILSERTPPSRKDGSNYTKFAGHSGNDGKKIALNTANIRTMTFPQRQTDLLFSLVISTHRVVSAEHIQIQSAIFFNRIAVEPAHEDGMVEAVAVVVKPCFRIIILRRELVPEHIDKGTGLGNQRTKGIVSVRSDNIAVFINILRDVAVAVIARKIEFMSGGVRCGSL